MRPPKAEEHLGLIGFVARSYLRSGYIGESNIIEFEDLFNEGYFGLEKAIERYKPSKGKFSTYAVIWIRQAISRALGNRLLRTVREPIYLQQINGHEPLQKNHLEDWAWEQFEDVKARDLLAEKYLEEAIKDAVWRACQRLEKRKKRKSKYFYKMFSMRAGWGEERATLKKIGKKYKLTKERIRQILKQIIREVKKGE